MNIQVAVLCDAATDENGKLNLLGAFDTIYTQQLPAVHPQCSIALRVTFGHEDEGQHKLRLNFVDADGGSIMPSTIDIPVQVVLPGGPMVSRLEPLGLIVKPKLCFGKFCPTTILPFRPGTTLAPQV